MDYRLECRSFVLSSTSAHKVVYPSRNPGRISHDGKVENVIIGGVCVQEAPSLTQYWECRGSPYTRDNLEVGPPYCELVRCGTSQLDWDHSYGRCRRMVDRGIAGLAQWVHLEAGRRGPGWDVAGAAV